MFKESTNQRRLGWCHHVFQHGGAFVTFDSQMVSHRLLLHDDVNVPGDELADFFAVRRLHGVIAILVVAEVLK